MRERREDDKGHSGKALAVELGVVEEAAINWEKNEANQPRATCKRR